MTRVYRGADRRGTIWPGAGPAWWLAGCVAVVVGVEAFGLLPLSQGADHRLHGLAAGLGLAAASLCLLLWRDAGDAPAVWLGAGLVPTAAALLAPEHLAAAGHLAGAGALTLAAVTAEVDTRLRRWWLPFLPSVAAGVLLALPLPGSAPGLAWAFATAVLLARALTGRAALLWFAVAGGALAASVSLGSGLVATVGLAVPLAGLLGCMRNVARLQRDRLFQATVDRLHAQARTEGAAYAGERAAHDAQNSLTALAGAALTLDRHRERLDEETREELSRGVRRELERLHALMASHDAEQVVVFRVAAALRPLSAGPGRPGHWDVPEDLSAYGRVGDTSQALRLLLECADEGAEIGLAARADGLMVRVEVHGVRAERLHLEVARTLIEVQGGTLEALEGGAGYGLTLPGAPG